MSGLKSFLKISVYDECELFQLEFEFGSRIPFSVLLTVKSDKTPPLERVNFAFGS